MAENDAAAPVLSLRGVSLTFGKPPSTYEALDNINLDVRRGDFVCLLGPSGCGKTTLLNTIAGFLPITSGTAEFNGKRITGPGPERMMVFQDSNLALLPWLTANDNVAFGMELRGVPRRERLESIPNYLSAVGLGAYGDRFPHQMSGGMRQRLQIARALTTRPTLLLMDEPFGALDALTRRHMHEVILDIWKQWNLTIIFVTHDIAESVTLADHVAVMTIGPHSHIREELNLHDLARPRDPTEPDYGKAYRKIEHLLDADPNLAKAL